MKFKDLWGLILPLLAILVVVYIVKISDKVDKPAVENHAGAVDDSYYPSKQQAVGESLEKSDVQYHGGYAYVDMGTSVMWATNNLGAASPELTGDTYTWGEIRAQKGYSRNYKYGEGDWKVTKYCEEDESTSWAGEGQPDGLTKLLPEDDAACNSWGNGWRMPSSDEWKELSDKCNWKWVMYNDVYGFLVTAGNGNCIFLPANKKNARTNRVESLKYWSSSLAAANSAYCMDGDGSPRRGMNYEERRAPLPIRAVLPKEKAADVIEPERSVVYSFPTKDPNHHEWVDLGLSVKWATCNVGASSVEETGGYYAWGEFFEKAEYSMFSYIWSSEPIYVDGEPSMVQVMMTKYSNEDRKTHLDREDDVASVMWGRHWRLPSKEEWEELRNNCNWEWKQMGTEKGYRITSRKNGNSIFLPAGGWKYNNDLIFYLMDHEGLYLSSDKNDNWNIWSLSFSDDNIVVRGDNDAKIGYSVRPVWDSTSELAETALADKLTILPVKESCPTGEDAGYEWVDLGLSVKWASCNVGATRASDYGNYYAWGEIRTKEKYSSEALRYKDGNKYTKYCSSAYEWGGEGDPDGKKKLELADDAAHASRGGGWRIPTDEEWTELQRKCGWSWTMRDGCWGYLVYSRESGNSIFLPAAGSYGYDGGINVEYDGAFGSYWSSSLYWTDSFAYSVSFSSKEVSRDGTLRYFGLSIRPVTDR